MGVTGATAATQHAARRVKRKASVAGCKGQRTKITSADGKTVNVSKTGAKPIPAMGAKRSLGPKYRYKISSMMTGSALQEDIASTVGVLVRKGARHPGPETGDPKRLALPMKTKRLGCISIASM
jgi:hypothetical protein